jgi:hypothetical protein
MHVFSSKFRDYPFMQNLSFSYAVKWDKGFETTSYEGFINGPIKYFIFLGIERMMNLMI